MVDKLDGVPEWDPFPNHQCETCDKRRAGYSADDVAVCAEQYAAKIAQLKVEAVQLWSASRRDAERTAEEYRIYYSKKEVEKRCAAQEEAEFQRRLRGVEAHTAAQLQHHLVQENERVYNLPENVAKRVAAQAGAVARQEFALAAANTPELVALRRAVWDGLTPEQRGMAEFARLTAQQLEDRQKLAGVKALELLKGVIGEERFAYYQQHNKFYFLTPNGHKYRIDKGYSQQVYTYETPTSVAHSGTECCYPQPSDRITGEMLPNEDLMAGQFLSLMNDEAHFLRTSYPSYQPSWRIAARQGNVPVDLDIEVMPDGSVVPKRKLDMKIDLTTGVLNLVTSTN